MPYLVDGYNLARASGGLGASSRSECDAVVRFLNRFARIKKTKITVIFDGHPPPSSRSNSLSQNFDAVKILFSGSESNADTKIKKLIASVSNRRGWIVVSSDRSVHGYARSTGLMALKSDEFITMASELLDRENKENAKVEKEETEYWLRVFGEMGGKPEK